MENKESIISKYVIYSKTDLKGVITEVSDAFCSISGYTKEELIGQPHNIVRDPDMPASAFKDMWDTIQSGNIWTGEVKNRKKDGGYYWVTADIAPQKDIDGNILSYIAIRHDITAKKDFISQHEQLLQAEKMSSLGDMIINISHQWRQPLSVISTLVSSMQMQKEFNILSDDKFNESCDTINKNVQNLSKTINDFQSYAEDENAIAIFNINNIIERFMNLVTTSIDQHDIEMVLSVDKNIKIQVIENKLIECFINIFNNAKDILQTLPKENRYIFITIIQKKDTVIIKFKDSAGGIPEDIIDKIFEPYFTTKHQSQGTGLGLHMTYNTIVNIMKGTIEVNNSTYTYKDNNFTGAEFTIRLPTNN